jgi:hypothetical protein
MKLAQADLRRVTEQVFNAIEEERGRQDAKWGSQRQQHNLKWNAILGEEVGEAAKEVLEENDELLWKELVQVAAVAVAWLEALYVKEAKRQETERIFQLLDGQTTSLSS